MAGGNVIAQIRKGMEVKFSDGKTLGKVAHVWVGTDPVSSTERCDEEVCSRLEVHRPHWRGTVYIPYNAIAGVSANVVNLNLDEEQANLKLWHQRPTWLSPEQSLVDFDHLVRPHSEWHGE
jgi:hypothetical protein